VLNANMASPVRQGTLGVNPFLNKHVKVLHENILITLNDKFDYANFDIEYQIESDKDGINIPFLFYAIQYQNDFELTIDGKKIDLKVFKDFWDAKNIKNNNLTNFEYIYTLDRAEVSNINIDFKSGSSDHLTIKDFIYFETNLSKGKHIIKVSYKASQWQYDHSRLKEMCYKYALSPAKYWKSFGTLDIKIDASDFTTKFSTNLGKPLNGNLESIANYQFKEMPVDVISISLEPKLSKFTKFLIGIEAFGLALFFTFFLALIHWRLMYRYRKNNPKNKFSFITLLGGILIPIIFVFALIFSSLIIDSFIGIYASGRASYGLMFSFYFLPKFWMYYLVFVFVLGFIFKKIVQRNLQE